MYRAVELGTACSCKAEPDGALVPVVIGGAGTEIQYAVTLAAQVEAEWCSTCQWK